MTVSGTFAANGVSSALVVQANGQLTATLSTAGADTMIGTARLERSDKVGAWEPVRDVLGALVVFTGATGAELGPGAIASVTVQNGPHRASYRWRMTGFDDDDVLFAMADVENDIVDTLLRDRSGNPMLQVLGNGGLLIAPKLRLAGNLEVLANVVSVGGDVEERVDEVTISAANIIGTGAGQFGHAAGFPIVAAPGADKGIELVSAFVVNDRATAAYTDGGNVTVNWAAGGAAITGLVAAAAFLGAATDTRHLFVPLAAAAMPIVANAGLNLVAAAAFTNPGTAAGVVRVRTRYRVHELGLA